MTSEGRLVGTIEYIPPERVKGQESDARGDIYSLGVVLFEMICGRLPFQSDSEYELMRCHLQEPLPAFQDFRVDVPPQIESVVRRATAKSPDDRFSSCDEFAQALHEASGNLAISKKAIIDLVGTLTIQQLGTAGHETLRLAGTPLRPPLPRDLQCVHQARRLGAGSLTACLPSPQLEAHVAVAAVVLSIAAGLLIGLVSRHGNEPDIQRRPGLLRLRLSRLFQLPFPRRRRLRSQRQCSPWWPGAAATRHSIRGHRRTDNAGTTHIARPEEKPRTPSRKPKDRRSESLKALDQ